MNVDSRPLTTLFLASFARLNVNLEVLGVIGVSCPIPSCRQSREHLRIVCNSDRSRLQIGQQHDRNLRKRAIDLLPGMTSQIKFMKK